MKRIGLFIDQANLWSTYKTAGKKIDLSSFLLYLEGKFEGTIKVKNIYLAYPEQSTREYNVDGIHKFTTYLHKRLGFCVTKKALKRILIKGENNLPIRDNCGNFIYREKGNLDVELTIDVVRKEKEYDIMVLISGDSDFLPLATFLRKKNKKTYIFSSEGHISSELRTGADGYIDLTSIPSIWGEKLHYRNEKP